MAALPSVAEASCKWRIDQTIGNNMAPQHKRSTKMKILCQVLYSASLSSDSSIIISATLARTF